MNRFEPYELQFDDTKRKQFIAESLIALRQSKNYTQKQVAEFLGIHPVTYNGYEKAKNEPSAETVVRLAYLYHVPTDLILQANRLDENHTEDVIKQIEFYEEKLALYKGLSLKDRDTAIMQMVSTVAEFIETLKKLVIEQAEQGTLMEEPVVSASKKKQNVGDT